MSSDRHQQHQPQRAVIVSFDGNIGSGKSTTGIEYEQYVKMRMRKAADAADGADTTEATPVFPTITSFDDPLTCSPMLFGSDAPVPASFFLLSNRSDSEADPAVLEKHLLCIDRVTVTSRRINPSLLSDTVG